MGIRYYKPTTAGRRQGSVSDFVEITDRHKQPEKTLLLPKPKKGGRNHHGFTCTRFRGGGHKRMYRLIDFKRDKDNVWANVVAIEYDPNRSSRIALVEYEDGHKAYILAPEGLKAGDKVMSGEGAEPKVGNCLPLKNISIGKAGRKRWLGRRPHNRGTSMNPVSHPMGGGEGRTSGGRHPCSPTGVLAKGGKTRKKRKPSNAAILRRRRPGPHFAPK